MKWKIDFCEFNEYDDRYEEHTIWASSFFEAFGYFSSCVMDETCRKCIVTAYYLDKPYGNSPVLVYDNTL